MSRTRVLILGSGTPNAEADRAGPSLAIAVDDQPYLVDCGHGAVQRVVQARAAGKIAWDTTRLNRLFVTHLHADHTVALPDLLFTPWIHGREDPVQAVGPTGLKRMARRVTQAYAENIQEHQSAHPCSADGFRITTAAAKAGLCYADERIEVEALPADHGDMEAWSYKFTTPGAGIVVSGDTKPAPGFADFARGCDLLIHEVYSAARLPERPPAWQAYHSRVHTSTDELAALAAEVRPGLLLLTHQLFWGQSADELADEIRAGYSGPVQSANDLDIFAF